jgi:hypothetical protein
MVIALFAMVSVASATLPSSITAYVSYEGTSSYFDLHVVTTTGGDDTDLAPSHIYPNTWCVDAGQGNYITPGVIQTFNVKSSLPNPDWPITNPVVKWQSVNYVINNKATMDKYSIQRVLWNYDGDPNFVWGSPDMTKVANSIKSTDDYLLLHPTWKPTFCSEKYAVILDSPDAVQLLMVEMPMDNCVYPPPAPEFPTMALPAGMIIGIVGLVYAIKGREN